MSDILVAMPDVTKSGNIVFGKNSDRPAGECQVLYYSPGGKQVQGSHIHCSYVNIPQAKHVMATFGCRPYWCWGYETAMNDAGVIGGNVAVFTRKHWQERKNQTPGLTGMDLLRLGLERGQSAEEAINVIIDFLEHYGQQGSAVQGQNHNNGSYNNDFLLADRSEAWILETAGRRWVAERITSGTRAISNQLTIRSQWTKTSSDLVYFAQHQNWWNPEKGPFDFALCYSDHKHYARQVSHIRWMRSRNLLERNKGTIDTASMMNFLRDHYEDTFIKGPQFHQYLPDFLTICMHDSPAGFTWGNTATSVVVELDPEDPVPPPYWLCYGPPCSGIYTAFFLGSIIPETVTRTGTAGLVVQQPVDAPKDTFDHSSLWWRFYRILEAVKELPIERHAELRNLLSSLEQRNLERVSELYQNIPDNTLECTKFVQEEIEEVMKALEKLERKWQIKEFRNLKREIGS